jgi:hypothetical protein
MMGGDEEADEGEIFDVRKALRMVLEMEGMVDILPLVLA